MKKLNSQNTMIYSGNVSLRIKIKDKIIEINNHNSGLPAFFRGFAKVMAGYDLTVTEKPAYIDLQYKATGETEYSTCLNSPLTFTKMYTTTTEGDWVTIFTTILVASSIAIDISSYPDAEFRLCLQSRMEDLATIKILYSDLERIISGTQGLIEWTLKVTDPSTR